MSDLLGEFRHWNKITRQSNQPNTLHVRTEWFVYEKNNRRGAAAYLNRLAEIERYEKRNQE